MNNHPLLSISNPVKFLKPPIPYDISLNTSAINSKQRRQSKTLVVKSNKRSTTTQSLTSSVSVVTRRNNNGGDETTPFRKVGRDDKGQAVLLCALGYWVQGSRCFPWLALNFHMAHCLNLKPSTIQLVQYTASLPMVAKPLYGVLSDVLYIGGARRVPYISIGVLLQGLAWGSLAIFPAAREVLPSLMAFVLLSNLGASITEVSKDALVAEYGLRYQMNGLQSYALMASAVGGILGNLLGGYCLLKTPPRILFLAFTALLSLQLIVSLSSKEESVNLPPIKEVTPEISSVLGIVKKQFLDLMVIVQADEISQPLTWIVASIAMVPLLSGSVFGYQTQVLNLDPSVIGMSKVIGQLMLLCLTVVYDRYWKTLPMRPLIHIVQLLYAFSLLFDYILVKQINLAFGISNTAFVLCCSSVAEILSQFKILPFSVLLANKCPGGCEGSITSFLASTLCLSSVVSAFAGVGMANMIGITSKNYTNLPAGILIQSLAALVPLWFIHYVPMSEPGFEKEGKRAMSKKSRRNRRVGRVIGQEVFAYRRERET
ncbi:probable folate-biopterin transporter 9, chloroplastic isoform X1 [Arabidopsis lyrata subsp. lyrata]|nr:probable folate-biopterin transporter 9, chloroplastic isoform X1 [Arabidopsis lyrata subsp. lyrata]|eukprot:XP_002879444.2 probable folate-biopterin transporter 9, chloroplastic isoform X1 [Arabidopsis lyrata subsp. lyrata]